MRGYLFPIEIAYIICRIIGVKLDPWEKEIFNHALSFIRKIIERRFGVLKAHFPILKRMTLYSLQTQVIIIVATVTLHDCIRQEVKD